MRLTFLFAFPLLALCQSPRPLVVWHGLGIHILLERLHWFNSPLGDSYNSTGMAQFQALVKEIHPGIFVHSVYIDKNQDNDRKAGFVRLLFSLWFPIKSIHQEQYGNVNEQVAFVADQLASIPDLENGFDAIGFSQGSFLHQNRFESS